MNMNLIGRIFGLLGILITLALAPSINTANTTVASGNLTNLIGMTAVTDFGAPLIVLGLLALCGLFAVGKLQSGSIQDLLRVIGAVIVAIVGLTFMADIVDYTNTLIAASTGFAVTIYGMIPLLVYIVIVAGSAYTAYKTYKGGKKGSKKAAYANF